MINFAAIAALLFLTSCASYVNALHKQINREEHSASNIHQGQMQRRQYPQRAANDPYAAYRYNRYSRENDKRPIQNPKTLGGYPSTSTNRNVYPQVRREYTSERIRAEDLKDNGSDGSLWSGKNSENYLFVTNNIKKRGDIVIVEVLSKLKNDITDELKRAFPAPAKKETGEDDVAANQEDKQAEESGPESDKKSLSDKKVHDKISTQVVEAINKDYLLIRGRKEVIFKKAKRYIEVQALVSRKDITDNDTVVSDRVLEPKIKVLRY